MQISSGGAKKKSCESLEAGLMQAIRSNKAVIDYHYLLLGFIVCHTLWGIYLLIVNWSVEAQLVLSLLI